MNKILFRNVRIVDANKDFKNDLLVSDGLISRIDIKDRIIQINGDSFSKNIIDDLIDIKSKIGNVYYLRITRKHIEKLYEAVDEGRAELKGALKGKITQNKDLAMLSKKLRNYRYKCTIRCENRRIKNSRMGQRKGIANFQRIKI